MIDPHLVIRAQYERRRAEAFRRRVDRFRDAKLNRFQEAAYTDECRADLDECDRWFAQAERELFTRGKP